MEEAIGRANEGIGNDDGMSVKNGSKSWPSGYLISTPPLIARTSEQGRDRLEV
ncbi:hypothetical protein TREMEDRAFT_56693 [Tremella mesenterica DSM 1558]|nr:uncharacterized protein TREMEDRAFT_56693 [Tremella mesenterica DSM 1558]EIW70910.1 hypothetical protein TREMEDRAFT_56693 [Tremella mesenterica DSM 1558]